MSASKGCDSETTGAFVAIVCSGLAFSDVITGLTTGLPRTERGYDAIATFVCHLSKYAYFMACHSTITAEEYANLFL